MTKDVVKFVNLYVLRRFSLYDRDGKRKEGEQCLVDIGGPMCFQVLAESLRFFDTCLHFFYLLIYIQHR